MMATNLLERYGEKHGEIPFLDNAPSYSVEDVGVPVEAISFSRIASKKIRRFRPRLKNEQLSLMHIYLDDLVIIIEALYAVFCRNVSEDIPLDDIYGKVIRHIHKTRDAINWIPLEFRDATFKINVCREKNMGMLQFNDAPSKIGAYNILDANIEIRHETTGECIWFVSIERYGDNLNNYFGKFLIYEKKNTGIVADFVEFAHSLLRNVRKDGRRNRTIHYYPNGGLNITMSNYHEWNDIFMTDEVKKNLHDDFHFFLKNKGWFRENRLQFKRGYLLTGLPGNGKTSAIRVMASTPGFQAFSFDFTHAAASNEELYKSFGMALLNAPSIFIIEDVDRIFEEREGHTKVTKDAILNCLDGLGDRDGVIVVATANNPELLDDAILKRPGRFDRVVKFAPPDAAMRHAMLTKLFLANTSNRLDEDTLAWLVAESNGFSMASVKEIYIASASLAFQDGSLIISAEHACEAITAIRKQYAKPAAKSIGLR
jgi:hypothetical protein